MNDRITINLTHEDDHAPTKDQWEVIYHLKDVISKTQDVTVTVTMFGKNAWICARRRPKTNSLLDIMDSEYLYANVGPRGGFKDLKRDAYGIRTEVYLGKKAAWNFYYHTKGWTKDYTCERQAEMTNGVDSRDAA